MRPKDPYICERCDEIEALLTDAASWAKKDEKLGAHLAAYICVLVLGMLEDCVEHLVTQRVDKIGDSEIRHYIGKVIGERFKNPDLGKIRDLLGEFSQEYRTAFTDKIPYNGKEADALLNVVTNKNSLAHRGTSKLNLTVTDVYDYYHCIRPILVTLEEILA